MVFYMANTITKQLAQVALTVAVVSGIIMALSLGVGEAVQVVIQPDEVSADTNASFGGSVDFVDRIATAGVFAVVLTSLGAISVSSSNPKVLNDLIRYAPLVVGLIGITSFSTEVSDILSGDFDYDLVDDARASYLVFIAMSTITGILSLLGLRNGR
jgi:hypothetical protein